MLALSLSGVFFLLALLVIYRLFFHPLHNFPGPKVAAISGLYEFYFDVVKDGSYLWQIEKMHLKYGPIVRINPSALHIKDPSFFSEIYSGITRPRDKLLPSTRIFGSPTSIISTTDHYHHSKRRRIFQRYFTKDSVRRAQHSLHENANKLVDALNNNAKSYQPLNLSAGFAALTTDVITPHLCGSSIGCLSRDDFQNDVQEQVQEIERFSHINRFVPFLEMPRAISIILVALSPRARKFATLEWKIHRFLMTAVNQNNLPKNILSEAFTNVDGSFLLRAGTETSAAALSVTRLREELRSVMPLPSSCPLLSDLNSLPFLDYAFLGVLARTARIPRNENLYYKGWMIPKGTPISQIIHFVHMDPQIFPDPHTFSPDRWIEATQRQENLESMMMIFNKGSRQCLGQQ
ncbi:cytochrome P450 [Aspergillus sclerotioniger CBS 115572]|uniref:Cytochrome P450 n=1 Tax=Aspergillus sclerotioniger CBS 115572 TaxID=1450535 RepID=A0A317VBP5_9EURO|nr:cytochrome P450 [Aspergillus sclerotioniger CBS 115572]PWY71783.1 cytochrome P450 [Aspergillus sclerotioniger CBS 115572]